MITVIFDMDGLMFDTESVLFKAWDYAGERIGIGKAGHMTIKTLGMNGSMSRTIWQEVYGDNYDEEALSLHTKEFLADYYRKNGVPLKLGLLELLSYLRDNKYKLALASSSPSWEVNKHLTDVGIIDYFDTIISGDMVALSKPNPSIYLEVCRRLGVNPKECFVLEDSKSGLLSAYHAGCKIIMVPDLWQADSEIEKILYAKFNNLIEVKSYFENIL